MIPSITFVIPAYNAETTLSLCLNSILAQKSDKKFEIIVVDNNSTDRTPHVAQAYAEVRLLREKNQGRSYARNTGAKVAQSEFLAFVDADVILDPYWLDQITKVMTHKTAAAQGPIVPSSLMGRKSLNSYRYRTCHESTDGSFILLNVAYKESPMINTAACLYRKAVFDEVGGFDPRLVRHEDIDLSKRVLLQGYDLAISHTARSEVIFNGVGWYSYLMRSYEDGFYKRDYLKKWESWLFMPQKCSPKTNARMFLEEVPGSVFQFLRTMDTYFLLKAINSCLKSLGRLTRAMIRSEISSYNVVPKRSKGYVLIDNTPVIEFDMGMKTVNKIKVDA